MSSSEDDIDDHHSRLSQHDEANEGGGDQDEPHASDEERDGRFYGPDGSWRFYTQAERDLAASLDHAQNNDLSIHLYNAHAWKRRHRDENLFRKAQAWHSKRRWVRSDETGQSPFLPHDGWTAWPLPPEDVPRSREQWGIPTTIPNQEPGTYFQQRVWKPSLDLQEELQAVILRKAKEKFRQREWQGANNVGDLETSTHGEKKSEGLPEGEQHSTSLIQKLRLGVTPVEDLKKPKTELLDEMSPAQAQVPVFTADDETAAQLLKPTVRHITKKLDDLLVGLHRSRQGHRKEPGAPRGRTASRSKSRSRTRPIKAGSTSKRKRVATDASQLDDATVSGDDDETAQSPERSRSRSRHRPSGLRDWSEVLGVAALTGWDQRALDRAAKRCAAVLGETMSMRTMPESSARNPEEELVEYHPQPVPEFDASSENASDEIGDDHEKGFNVMRLNCCPYTTCSRHEESYDSRWRLREHLKRKHALNEDDLNAMEEIALSELSEDEDFVKGEVDDEEDLHEIPGIHDAAIRRDGFLEPINISLWSKRKEVKTVSSSGQ